MFVFIILSLSIALYFSLYLSFLLLFFSSDLPHIIFFLTSTIFVMSFCFSFHLSFLPAVSETEQQCAARRNELLASAVSYPRLH